MLGVVPHPRWGGQVVATPGGVVPDTFKTLSLREAETPAEKELLLAQTVIDAIREHRVTHVVLAAPLYATEAMLDLVKVAETAARRTGVDVARASVRTVRIAILKATRGTGVDALPRWLARHFCPELADHVAGGAEERHFRRQAWNAVAIVFAFLADLLFPPVAEPPENLPVEVPP